MMSPVMPMTGQRLAYTPRSDVLERHEYGVTKPRKTASTGGGRAWSEEEEAYLIQTRMQKMPYKHIAAHLKKTELACRLHYHQLSHGSNRRKRTTSLSSGSSNGHSPVLQGTMPSPIHEHAGSSSRSVSPVSAGSYGATSPGGIQLPSIMTATAQSNTSPHLPTILPKPASMGLTLNTSPSTGTGSPTATRPYPNPLHDAPSYRGPSNPTSSNRPAHGHGPLRLDCSALPPPPSANGSGLPAPPGFQPSHPVDMARLTAIYNAHRASFWAAIAADYGPGANPLVLEQAWRSTPPSGSSFTPASSSSLNVGIAARTPITPVGSPDDQLYSAHCSSAVSTVPPFNAFGFGGGAGSHHHQQQQQQQGAQKQDKTRISAILGIDASPRSPHERDVVKRIEEGLGGTAPVAGMA
ncbi:hypothetical protein VTJ49DRAFT_5915 [Mycothermus thermophilus]|uniref:Myb-like domain-containing protein n=1 Tax=Humicola insolens TaxID=85995 RepID=A0ABR3V2R0_HUMIN